jgi:hypothetical protein
LVLRLIADQSGLTIGDTQDARVKWVMTQIEQDMSKEAFDQYLKDLKPSLAAIEAQLRQVKAQFNLLIDDLMRKQGEIVDSLTAAVGNPIGTGFVAGAGQNLDNLLSEVQSPGDFLEELEHKLTQAIEDEIVKAFMSSGLTAQLQQVLRQFLAEGQDQILQALNPLFDDVNAAIRDLASHVIKIPNPAKDAVRQALKGLDKLAGATAAAKIRGAPTFAGDTMQRIHLDGDFEMTVGAQFDFRAYMDIVQLTSKSTSLGCTLEGDQAAEVTLGAKDVKLGPMFGSVGGTVVSMNARWTLLKGDVIGLGGGFDIKGALPIPPIVLKEVGATIAFGHENYMAANGKGVVLILGIPFDVGVGFFAGKTCLIDALRQVDPEVEQVLPNAIAFTGIYVACSAGVSLSDLIGMDLDCVLDAQIGAKTAVYLEFDPSVALGIRQKLSVDASFLCALSAHAALALGARGSFDPLELDMKASAELCAEILFFSGCLGFELDGHLNSGGLKFSIDY